MTSEQIGFQLIAKYLEAIAEKPLTDVLYRGHGDETWDLTPSAFRDLAWGIDNEEKLEKWMRAAARLASPRPRSSVEWLALAQHYGIPTPLLDWTANPLVALFFAAYEAIDKVGCVWQVRTTSAFEHLPHPESVTPFRKDRARPGLVHATAMNPRSRAQSSAMSIHRDAQDTVAAELLRVAWRVQPGEKIPIVDGLAALGLEEGTLFSDLALLAKHFQNAELII